MVNVYSYMTIFSHPY